MAVRWLLLVGVIGVGWPQRYCPVDRAFLRLPHQSFSFTRTSIVDTFWVPVVFHVISLDSSGWLSPSLLGAQLRALNRDFVQAGIQFYLPRYGPDGQPTCGVTWTLSPLAYHDWTTDEDTLKKLIRWPTDSFLNVWVVDRMVLNTIGYARALRDTAGIEGVVLVRSVVGERGEASPPFDWGRTAVHEVGHVFSLLHPFEGGCVGMTPQTCAAEGDEICDTPPQRNPLYGCPSLSTNTCQETPIDLADPVDNLMGYVDDSCMVRFTSEQVQRMRLFLQQQGPVLISPENRLRRGWGQVTATSCPAVLEVPIATRWAVRLVREGMQYRIEGVSVYGMHLYGSSGRKVQERRGEHLSVEGLPTGIYVLTAETDRGLFSWRIWVP